MKENTMGSPSTYIQWKGTDVCMDVRCVCGAHGHIDAEFAYYIECGACHRVYETGTEVTLTETDRAKVRTEPIITYVGEE